MPRRGTAIGFCLLAIGAVAVVYATVGTQGVEAQGEGDQATPQVDYGILSLLPAFVALTLAYLTRQVLMALFLGVVCGSIVVFSQSQEYADLNFLAKFLIPSLGTQNYAQILLVYLWCLGGILGIWSKTGGARHFAERIGTRIAQSPRGAKLFAWMVGCIFHQGGTVSTVLAGTTVKPVSDRHRISHEELSYIVDSTASPVATIIPFNAWPLVVGGFVAGATLEGHVLIGDDEGAAWFFGSIPFNFYGMFAVLSTLLFSLGLLPWTGKRMRLAIERARSTGKLDADDAEPMLDASMMEANSEEDYPTGLEDFFLPLGLLVGIAIVPWLLGQGLFIKEAFLVCTLSAMVLARFKGMRLRTIVEGFIDGCKSMTLGAIILGLAITLGDVARELNTADFLIDAIGEKIPTWLLPLALTATCMIISFSVGSSFGTYAVIFPIAIPLAFKIAIDAQALGAEPVSELAERFPDQWETILFYVHICFGAVLGGAVFGDQCSPISDTTILSSMFTGCDLMDHVKTQLPLALAAAGLGAVCSTLLVIMSS